MKIILCHNLEALEHHLKNKGVSKSACFLSFGPLHHAHAQLLKKHGVRQLPKLRWSSSQRKSMLENYLTIVSQMGKSNNSNELWWATDFSSRNRVTSQILALLSQVIRPVEAVKQCKDCEEFYLSGLDWPVILTLQAHFRQTDAVTVLVISNWISRFKSKISGALLSWKIYARDSLKFLLTLPRARRSYRQNIDFKGKPVYLIRSFSYTHSFTVEGYKDSFFPGLAAYAHEKLGRTWDVVTVASSLSSRHLCYKKMNESEENIIPLTVFLPFGKTLFFMLASTFKLIICKWHIPEKITFCNIDISILLRELFSAGGWRIQPEQLLYRLAGTEIASRMDIQAAVIPYEANPWENMLVEGLRKNHKDMEIIGYQHTVVPLSSAGYFKTEYEIQHQPMPNKILTVGKVTANIIHKNGALPPTRVHPACALRYTYLKNAPFFPRNAKVTKVLVALEGLNEVIDLAQYAIKQASIMPDVEFILRAHPYLPISSILKLLNLTFDALPSNVTLSNNTNVKRDVENCDVVLYWGTTVSIEAITLGRPVIHFDRGDILSYDPLFELDDFHWVVSPGDNLQLIIDTMNSMSTSLYENHRKMAQSYVSQYFYEVNNEALNKFLPGHMMETTK